MKPKNEDKGPVGVEDTEVTLAEAIKRISSGVDKLLATGLNREAVIVLLCHRTKLGRRTVVDVLDGLADLAKKYTK